MHYALFAMIAGLFGALSGVFGKLTLSSAEGNVLGSALPWWTRMIFFALNGVCTAQMWRYYLKALRFGPTPACQVSSTGSNLCFSAVMGYLLFGETVTTLWFVGASCVVVGLACIVS